MFSHSAELYDLIYGQFKNYEQESEYIAALLSRWRPAARSVLDVGCGTGEHARILRARFGYEVDGIDLEPAFVRIAQARNPAGRFAAADMRNFALDRSYDAILCLFSAIGYVQTLANVRRTLESFRRHLAPGGVVILEPWIEPADWQPGRVTMHTAEREGLSVCRMGHTAVRERLSIIDFHYLLGRPDGVEHRREVHELGLFTNDELQASFRGAGFEVLERDPEGLIGRGLIVAAAGPPGVAARGPRPRG